MCITCTAKHADRQPTEKEWKCPRCGADYPTFFVNESFQTEGSDCEILHDEDYLECNECNYVTTGKEFSESLDKETMSRDDAIRHLISWAETVAQERGIPDIDRVHELKIIINKPIKEEN